MADANNIDMQSANEDVLLRSDGAAPAVETNVQHSQQSETNATSQPSFAQHPQQSRTNETAEESRSNRQLRLSRRERDHRTTTHREQLSRRLYHSTRHRHSSSASYTHHHHRYYRTIHLLLVTIRMNGHVDQNQGVSIAVRMTSTEDIT